MASREKLPLIVVNVVGAIVSLGWIGYRYMVYLAGALNFFGGSSSGPEGLFFVCVIVAVGSLACIVYSFSAPDRFAMLAALAPLALVGAGEGYLSYQTRVESEQVNAILAVREAKLARWPRDYVLQSDGGGNDRGITESFLTHDRELKTIVRLDIYGGPAISVASGVGKIDGDFLEIGVDERTFRDVYSKYLDKEGKSLADRYRIRPNPQQDSKDYHLEKYSP